MFINSMTENSGNPKRKTRDRYKASTKQLFTKLETLFFDHKFSNKPDWFVTLQKDAEANDGWINLEDIIKNDVTCKPTTKSSQAYLKELVQGSKLIHLNDDGSKVKSISDTFNAEDFGIFVDNIPLEANVCWVEEAFRNYGDILLLQMPEAKFKNELIKNRGFCFVYFSQPDDAKKTVETFMRHKNKAGQVIKEENSEKAALTESSHSEVATTKNKGIKPKRKLIISQCHQEDTGTLSNDEQSVQRKKIKSQIVDKADESKLDKPSSSVDVLQQSTSVHVTKRKIKAKKRRLSQLLQADDDAMTNPIKRTEISIGETVKSVSHEAALQQKHEQTSAHLEELNADSTLKLASELETSASSSSSKKKRKADDEEIPEAPNQEQQQAVKSVVLKVQHKKRRRTSSDGKPLISKQRRRSGKRQTEFEGEAIQSNIKKQRIEPEVEGTMQKGKRKHRRKNLNRVRRYIRSRHIRSNLLDQVNVYSYSDWLVIKREYKDIQKSNFQELKVELANCKKLSVDQAPVDNSGRFEKLKRSRDRILTKAAALSEAMLERTL